MPPPQRTEERKQILTVLLAGSNATVVLGAVVALFGSLAVWAGVTAWQSFRTPPADDTGLGRGSALGLTLFLTAITAVFAWMLVMGHRHQRRRREHARRRTGPRRFRG